MIKIGIIGLGGIAGAHIAAYRRLPEVKIVAAADSFGKEARSYEMIKDSDVKIYTDYKEMIKCEELDAVDICAPSHIHKELSIYALNCGLHVLCEKPMATSYSDAKEMASAAKKSGKIFMCAQVVRFSKPLEYLRRVVESGELGKPVQLFMSRLSAVPRWRLGNMNADASKNGGVILDLSIHDIDYVYSLFGEPVSINGVYHKASGENYNDFITANLLYDGFSVTVSGGFYEAEIKFSKEFYAVFEKGDLRLDRLGQMYKCGEPVDVADTVYKNEVKGLNIDLSSPFISELEYFTECIKCGKEPSRALAESTAGGIGLAERITKETKSMG